jgi:8-oxo-dGTP diphosphatase
MILDMAGIPTVAIIIENSKGEVLLQLRENKPNLPFANHWTLPGGKVEFGETPLQAAIRELMEETALDTPLSFWKVYERVGNNNIRIEQHVFTSVTDRHLEAITVGEGAELRFIAGKDIQSLQIAYGFDKLLEEFFSIHQSR